MPSQQPIPSVFRQPQSDVRSNVGSNRPLTLTELSEMATSGVNRASLTVDSSIPISRYILGSETLTKQAESLLQNDNHLDEACISLVKNCKLLIEILPTQHGGYKTLDSETRQKLKQKGQWHLDQLSLVKSKIVDRYEAWRLLNPDVKSSNTLQDATFKAEEKREPIPSTGRMPVQSTGRMDSDILPPSIEYLKPARSSNEFGLDVRNQSHSNFQTRQSSSPFTSSPLQPFAYSHHLRQQASPSSSHIVYPSLRPANSIKMNSHQVSQGFAPRSEQTYQYYQIQTSFPPRGQSPSRPLPKPSMMPSPSPFNYPTISGHNRIASQATVDQEAKRLLQTDLITHGTTTEGGEPLRTLIIPASLISTFVSIADKNTRINLETCGLLMGTMDANMLQVNHLLIPKQTASSDRCDTQDEEGIWNFMESRGLITLGWCHTHPQQSCFMSSLDLHTHSAYQATLPEAIAIVCAPNDEPSFGLFRLTSPFGLQTILTCKQPGLFHPHVTNTGKTIEAIYTDAVNGHVLLADAPLAVTDLRRRS